MHLLIDNYDSFTYNVVQALGQLGAEVMVVRNDRISVDEALALEPELAHHLTGARHARRRGREHRADPRLRRAGADPRRLPGPPVASSRPSAAASPAPTG